MKLTFGYSSVWIVILFHACYIHNCVSPIISLLLGLLYLEKPACSVIRYILLIKIRTSLKIFKLIFNLLYKSNMYYYRYLFPVRI